MILVCYNKKKGRKNRIKINENRKFPKIYNNYMEGISNNPPQPMKISIFVLVFFFFLHSRSKEIIWILMSHENLMDVFFI